MSTRTLKLTSPPMRGKDAEIFQRDLNAELGRWGIDYRLKVDGVYGLKSRDIGKSVCHGLGLAAPVMEHGATPAIRWKVRHRKLSGTELERYRAREEWRLRLKRRLDGEDVPVEAAIAFARSMLGIKEQPAGSNRGPKIDDWLAGVGIRGFGAPWCGAFANAVLVAGGFPDQEWLRYCPWIEQRARAGEGGWRWSSSPVVGSLVLYGSGEAVHVGFVIAVVDGWPITIEGNTTSGPGGPQADGGIVAQRDRKKDGSLATLPIRGYAVPPWGSV